MAAKTKKKVKKADKSLLAKARTLFDQADDILEEKVKDVKKSKAFKEATGKLKKLEGLAEDKVTEFKKSKTKKKIDKALAKAGRATEVYAQHCISSVS